MVPDSRGCTPSRIGRACRQRARTGGTAHTACGRASNAEGGLARTAAAPAPLRKAKAVRTRPRASSRQLVTGGLSAGGESLTGAGEVGYADGRLVAVPQVTFRELVLFAGRRSGRPPDGLQHGQAVLGVADQHVRAW